jgi:hypothetical protein
MPRYFFVVRGPAELVDDPEGQDLPSLEAARDAGSELARDIVRDSGLIWENWSLEIKDGAGETVLVVPFTDAAVKH